MCERIIEIPVRDWLVAPALQKEGGYHIRKPQVLLRDEQGKEAAVVTGDKGDWKWNEDDGTFAITRADLLDCALHSSETATQGRPAFGSIPYIARPHPEQKQHTGKLTVYIFKVGLWH